MGVGIYVTYQFLHLGTTGIDAYTPLTAFGRGDLHQAATMVQYNGSGVYNATLTSTGWSAGLDDGFLQISNVSSWPACPQPTFPCAIYNSTKVLVAVIATGVELWDVWYHMHRESEPSPVGWPGWDKDNPTLPDGWDWEMNGGQPTGDLVKHNPDGSTEKLHPELQDNRHGPHWDYGVYNGPGNDRAGRIYPNTDGPASGGTLVWNK